MLLVLVYGEGRQLRQLQAFSLGPWSMTSGRLCGAAGSTCMPSNCGRIPAQPTTAYARTPTRERCLTWAGRKWPRCSQTTGASGCGCRSTTTASAQTTYIPSASRKWSTNKTATATRTARPAALSHKSQSRLPCANAQEDFFTRVLDKKFLKTIDLIWDNPPVRPAPYQPCAFPRASEQHSTSLSSASRGRSTRRQRPRRRSCAHSQRAACPLPCCFRSRFYTWPLCARSWTCHRCRSSSRDASTSARPEERRCLSNTCAGSATEHSCRATLCLSTTRTALKTDNHHLTTHSFSSPSAHYCHSGSAVSRVKPLVITGLWGVITDWRMCVPYKRHFLWE